MNELREEAEKHRQPEHKINDLIYHRWSPRALGTDMTEEDLYSLFEAAKWAPSSYNNQHWRFIYATNGSDEFEKFKDLLSDFNQQWAELGYALVVLVSKETFDYNGEPAKTHSFDSGAAWQNLALEATDRGLVAHGMQGFDYEKAEEELSVPEGFNVEMMIAIGSKEDEESLEEDMQVEPSGRKDLDEVISRGSFDFEIE